MTSRRDLRIETIHGEQCVTIKLIGRVRADSLPELKAQIEASGSSIQLDLEEVTLVDMEAGPLPRRV
jgi:hypothetical protein